MYYFLISFLKLINQLFIYLAVLGLSCGKWDLPCIRQDLLLRPMDSLVVAFKLSSYSTQA